MAADAAAPLMAKVVRAVRRALGDGPDRDPSRTAADVLEAVVPELDADGGALLLMDPYTGLFWTGAVLSLPAASCHPFFDWELDAHERSFRRLAREGAGACARSVRADEHDTFGSAVLGPYGYADEVRVVARDAGVAWGGLSLWRKEDRAPFSVEHERALDAVAPLVGAALRDSVLDSLTGSATAGPASGALVIEEGVVVEASAEARAVLRDLDEPSTERFRPLDHIVAVSRRRPRFSMVVGAIDGHWVAAHGTPLGPSRTVVTLTAPTPADVLGALVSGAGLTAREVEVTRLLCRGLTDPEIARELTISAHTAHDHVRSVRAKLGVRNRAEVASRVFADRYLDGFLASATVVHEG